MTPSQTSDTTPDRTDPAHATGGTASAGAADSASPYWSRLDAAQAYADFNDPDLPRLSQREFAQQHGIPRATLGDWLRQDFPEHLHKDTVAFFRQPHGHAFLRRLLLALVLVFRHHCPCGIRPLQRFLELAQLDAFVASSYGALHTLDATLQELLATFASQERDRLAQAMPPKDIVLCPDENFHGHHVCLVAIEPVADFILVETYSQRRDADTWAAAIAAGVRALPVTVVLVTSDQASGLVCCAEKKLQVLHQPDLMHLQQNLAGPLLLPLTRPLKEAKKELDKAQQASARLDRAEQSQPDSVALEDMIAAVKAELWAEAQVEQARAHLQESLAPWREIGTTYHPFDRDTGAPVTAEHVQGRLGAALDQVDEVIRREGLGERACQAVARARVWVVTLVGCLAWFWAQVSRRVAELDLSAAGERVFVEQLVAGYYWELASGKEQDPAQRERLRALSAGLLAAGWSEYGPLGQLTASERAQVEGVARGCAGLFQRSSSCVEGRNGRLSLFHHGQTRLSEQRLRALTAVHNYVVKRADGTTAAERFFGQTQRDAFAWLLEHLPDLPRPAAKRPKQADRQRPAA